MIANGDDGQHLAAGAVGGDALLRGSRVRALYRQVGVVRAVWLLVRELRGLGLVRGLGRGLALVRAVLGSGR